MFGFILKSMSYRDYLAHFADLVHKQVHIVSVMFSLFISENTMLQVKCGDLKGKLKTLLRHIRLGDIFSCFADSR